jgi:hypothetical protein
VIMVVVVVVSHPAKLADLARRGGQFPTFRGGCGRFLPQVCPGGA